MKNLGIHMYSYKLKSEMALTLRISGASALSALFPPLLAVMLDPFPQWGL